MEIAIPPEFEALAREMVAAGAFASVEDAVTAALRHQLHEIEAWRALVDPAIAEADRGETVDGRAFLRNLIAETRTRLAG